MMPKHAKGKKDKKDAEPPTNTDPTPESLLAAIDAAAANYVNVSREVDRQEEKLTTIRRSQDKRFDELRNALIAVDIVPTNAKPAVVQSGPNVIMLTENYADVAGWFLMTPR